jgi:hypothetical protein
MPTNPAQLPFKEAIDFYKAKIKLPSADWTSIWEQQHSHAFVVAGAQSDALLEDLYNAIQDAKQNGGGYADFKNRFQDITTKHGWSYNGSPGWRSRIIYSTNITQSYNAGRYVQMQAVKHLRPFWTYRHTSIENPRLTHKAWDGITLPADDPWFDIHYPQNDYGCNCRIDSLSRFEAEQQWKAQGKTGPDTAPEIIYEDRVVSKNGNNPRTVTTPKGIGPGFGYNPGKAYLEPLTVPPLTGYDAVLKEHGIDWPTGFKVPKLPTPTKVDGAAILPADTPPELAVTDFLDVFGADMQTGAAFTDAAGSTLAISKALFEDGKGEFKWLSSDKKLKRLQYINLLAMALIDPDEIWWIWVKDHHEKGRWRLKRRYLKLFEVDGINEYAVSVFEWNKTGWTGSTAFMTTQTTEALQEAYFNKQRNGRLVFKK